MSVITKQQLEDASVDATTLETVVNGAVDLNGDGTLTSRLGTSLKTTAKLIDDLATQDIGASAAAEINRQLKLQDTLDRVNFDPATDSYGTIPVFPLDFSSEEFTIEFRGLTNLLTNQSFINRSDFDGFGIFVNSGFFSFGNNNGWVRIPIVAGESHIYRCVYDKSETGFARMKIFKDNAEQTTTTVGTYADFLLFNSNVPVFIGKRNLAFEYELDGWIENLKIWNRKVFPNDPSPYEGLICNPLLVSSDTWIDDTDEGNDVTLNTGYVSERITPGELPAAIIRNDKNYAFFQAQIDAVTLQLNELSKPRITNPVPNQGIQRDGATGSMKIEGLFVVGGGTWEWSFNGSGYTLGGNVASNGAFSATVTGLPTVTGDLIVRSVEDTDLSVTVSNIVIGDGILVGLDSLGEGRGTVGQNHELAASLAPSALREDGAYVEADDPVDTGTSNGSHWPLLARLLSTDSNVPIFFVTVATGGKDLAGATTDYYSKGQTGYDNILLPQALAAGGKFAKTVLHIGPNAALDASLTPTQYLNAVNSFVANIKADFDPGDVYIGCHGQSNASTNNDNVRNGTVQAINTNADILSGFNGLGAAYTDGVHPKTDLELATVAARTYAAMKGKVSPNAVSATLIDANTIDVLFDADLDTGVTNYTATAWVVNEVTDLTPSSVTRTGVRTVRIVTSTTVTTAALVSFALGRTHEGAIMPTSVKETLPVAVHGLTEGSNPAHPIFALQVV